MREEKIINPEIQDNAEENLEKTLRPQLLNEYIGQTKIKESHTKLKNSLKEE